MIPAPPEGIVYFVESGPSGPVKIGTSGSRFIDWFSIEQTLHARLKGLQSCNPSHIQALATTFEGGRQLEQSLHSRFESGHIRGEWFDVSTTGLIDYIQVLETNRLCVWCQIHTVSASDFLCDRCRAQFVLVNRILKKDKRTRRDEAMQARLEAADS